MEIHDAAVDLNYLADVLAETEEAHRQDVPLREDMRHVPVGCSCGKRYAGDDKWLQSRRHVRQAMALAVVRALHRTCDTCHGRGTWRKMLGELICPDCNGTGKTLTPLPAMKFFDYEGRLWRVDDVDPNLERALVSRED